MYYERLTTPTKKSKTSIDISNEHESINHTSKMNIITPPCTSKSKGNKGKHQLYLDFGQASFGKRKTCKTCNMVCVIGLEDDESNHLKLCKEYSLGAPFPGWKRELIVCKNNTDRIIEIRPSDPKSFQNKAMYVKSIIDKEMGFIDENHMLTTYFCISSKRLCKSRLITIPVTPVSIIAYIG